MGNSASNLPYKIETDSDKKFQFPKSGPIRYWTQYSGESKDLAAVPVSIFTASCLEDADGNEEERVKAKLTSHFFSKCKTLVHPSLVRVIAAEEVEEAGKSSYFSKSKAAGKTFYIVTEPVEPLRDSKLRTLSRDDIIYGLYTVMQGLVFLHANNLALGTMSMESVFVAKRGEWKLFDYSFLTELGLPDAANGYKRFPNDNYIQNYRAFISRFPPEIASIGASYEKTVGIHALDSHNVGLFVDRIFQGRIPEKLVKANTRLKAERPKMRPRLPGLLNCPVFKNQILINLDLALNDFMLKEEEEKVSLIHDDIKFSDIADGFAKYKVLPVFEGVIMAGTERNVILAILPKLFEAYEVSISSKDSFQDTKLNKMFLKLFEMSDRAVRANMLKRIDILLNRNYFEKKEIPILFDSMCSGFNDTHNQLREMTLKSMLPLLKLLTPDKTEKLLRYLIKLANDEEDSIRVNTAIFVRKISEYLTVFQVSKFVIAMLTKLSNDRFVPARKEALITLMKLSSKMETEDNTIATRVIPAISAKLIDSDVSVRREAFKILDVYVSILFDKLPEEDPETDYQISANIHENGENTKPLASAQSTNSFMSSTYSNIPISSAESNIVQNGGVGSRNFNNFSNEKMRPKESMTGLEGWSDDDEDDVFGNVTLQPNTVNSMNIASSRKSTSKSSGWSDDNDLMGKIEKLSLGGDDVMDGWDDF